MASYAGQPKSLSTYGQGTQTIEVDPVTLRDYLKALGRVDKEVQNEVRLKAQGLAIGFKLDLELAAAFAPTPQARLVAQSITTPKDRLPVVVIGGKKKVGREYRSRVKRTGKTGKPLPGRRIKAPAGALLYGSEFGSHGGKDRAGRTMGNRFVAPRTTEGYWINPTTEREANNIFEAWVEIVDDVLRREGIYGG